MHSRILLLPALGCLVLGGCKTGTPPAGAEILSDRARAEIAGSWSAGHSKGPVVPGWIHSFHDPALTRLVEEAIARNQDLKAAAAHVEASRAAVRISAASLYPQVGLKGLGERQGQDLHGDLGIGIDPPTLGSLGVPQSGGSADTRSIESNSSRWVYGIGVGAAWEADVWARVRSGKAAAKADSMALEADYESARQALAGQVARAYFSAIEASQQAANAQETLGLYKEYVDLTQVRKNQGFASDFELAQVKSRTAAAQDTVYAAESARAEAIRAIEVVTSHYPAGRATIRRSLPSGLGKVPSGLPSQLLERRPDLISAERRFAAAFHRVNEARAARLPRFGLSAMTGLGSAQLDGVGVLNGVNWSLASGVVQPIFLGGELKAAQDLRTAEQKAAAHNYTSAVLHAFEDVEDALSHEYYLRQREGALSQMVDASAQAAKLGRVQLDQGHADMFSVLRLLGENLAAKVELTKVRASRLRERVNLHLALGGDFHGASK